MNHFPYAPTRASISAERAWDRLTNGQSLVNYHIQGKLLFPAGESFEHRIFIDSCLFDDLEATMI